VGAFTTVHSTQIGRGDKATTSAPAEPRAY